MTSFRSRGGTLGSDGPVQGWTRAGPVAGPLPADDVERLQETQEVTVAEPAPPGLFGFATGEPAVIGRIGGYFLILPALRDRRAGPRTDERKHQCLTSAQPPTSWWTG